MAQPLSDRVGGREGEEAENCYLSQGLIMMFLLMLEASLLPNTPRTFLGAQ